MEEGNKSLGGKPNIARFDKQHGGWFKPKKKRYADEASAQIHADEINAKRGPNQSPTAPYPCRWFNNPDKGENAEAHWHVGGEVTDQPTRWQSRNHDRRPLTHRINFSRDKD